MDQPRNYLSYAGRVHELRRAAAFHAFFDEFSRAYKERLDRLEITGYPLTKIRAAEAAAFELAGDQKRRLTRTAADPPEKWRTAEP